MHNQTKAYFYAFLTVGIWSTVATAFKLSLRSLSPLELVSWASLISTVALGIVLIAQGKVGLLLRSRKRDITLSALLGALNPFAYYLLIFIAYSLMPAQEAQPLNITWPIVYVLMAALFLHQKVSGPSLLAFLVSLAGVAVIATRGDLLSLHFNSPAGVSASLTSAIVWALYWIASVRDHRDEVVKLFTGFLFGTLYCFIALTLTGGLRLPPLEGFAGAVYIGVFEMGITFIFWMKALKYSERADRVAILIYIIPFVSMNIVALFVGEAVQFSSVIGAALIVAGILLQKRLDRRRS